jgi:hypothetical protein
VDVPAVEGEGIQVAKPEVHSVDHFVQGSIDGSYP